MLQRRNICSIGAISLNVLCGQGFWCPGLSAAGGVRPEDMGHGTQGRGFCSQNSDLKREHDFNDLVLHLLIDTTYSECFVVLLLCCTQLTCLLFSHCSESEILHHDKQYEPFYSSFVALSTHYITTVCGLSKCSPSFASLTLMLWPGYSKNKLQLLSFWYLSQALAESDIKAERC